MPANPQAANYEITIPSGKVEHSKVKGFTIERDMYQPDMASIILVNQNDVITTDAKAIEIGGTVKVEVSGVTPPLFIGELIGVEPIYRGGEEARVVLRAVNKLHRLLRKRKSRTFTDKKDSDVFSTIAGEHGLQLEYKHTENTVTYKHIYQHNQTDLEFLRMRAARVGAHVWCDDKKLIVKFPTLDEASKAEELTVDASAEAGAVQAFMPRLSTTNVVKKVTVKGWNPETKELITGDASVSGSKLGSETSVAGTKSLAADETFTVDHPIWSQEEAKLIAKGRLYEMSLTYITGSIELHGYLPTIEMGKTVPIKASANAADPFTGKYYVMGISHKYLPSMKGKEGKKDVASMTVKLARDASKK